MTTGHSKIDALTKFALAATVIGSLMLFGCGSSGDAMTADTSTAMAACDPLAPPPAVGQQPAPCGK